MLGVLREEETGVPCGSRLIMPWEVGAGEAHGAWEARPFPPGDVPLPACPPAVGEAVRDVTQVLVVQRDD